MSFTMLLLLAYIVMSVGSFIAFKRKHKAIGIALLLVIVLYSGSVVKTKI